MLEFWRVIIFYLQLIFVRQSLKHFKIKLEMKSRIDLEILICFLYRFMMG